MYRPIKICAYFLFNATLVGSCGCFCPSKTSTSLPETISNAEMLSPKTIEESSTPPAAESTYFDLSEVDISKISKSRKLIALTFDDAPAKTAEQITSVFLGYNATYADAPASATLFCNGKNLRSSTIPSLEVALTAGFELGNHTQNHKDLTKLTGEALRYEIEETDRLLARLDGKTTHLLRTPYGAMNDEIKHASRAPIIDWFIDTLDWTGISAEAIYNAVWQGKGDGVIVLMHDGYQNTVAALRRLLPDLYDAGYQIVTVSQMAKAHGCPLKAGEVYTRARDLSKIKH